jgi:hypothetical protein
MRHYGTKGNGRGSESNSSTRLLLSSQRSLKHPSYIRPFIETPDAPWFTASLSVSITESRIQK